MLIYKATERRIHSMTKRSARSTSIARAVALALVFCGCLVLLTGFRSQPALFFTDDERQWLAENPEIRVATFPWFPPVIFHEDKDGKPAVIGLAPDYLQRVGEIHKLPFTLVQFDSKYDAWQALMNGEIDLIPALESTPEKRSDALFTSPYVKLPSVIITRDDKKGAFTEADLLSNRKSTAIVGNSPAHIYLAPRYPDLSLHTVSSVKEGLYMVSSGAVDAFIVDIAEAGHHLAELAVGNLRVAGETEHSLRIAMATHGENPQLRDVIDRAIETLLPETRSQIQNRWIIVAGQSPFPWQAMLPYAAIALLVLIIAAALIGSIVLRRKVKSRTQELNQTVLECKSTQQQLQQAFADAQNLADKLQAGNLALMELSEQKSEFLEILTHDLKSPINSILQTIQLYSQGDHPLPSELQECLSQIESIAEGAITTIEEMITIDALEGNQMVVNLESHDIASLTREVIQSLDPQAKAKNISIICGSPDSLQAKFDYKMLFMALENVIGNAIKFSPPGRSVWVTLTHLEKANLTRIDIKDQGPGLTANDKKRLFGKFARLSARPTAGESSTGLGLAITRKIIELHSGTIRADSCEHEGSVFTIEL